MRAKLPHTEGDVDRDGIPIHYQIYGEGERTMVFVPPHGIVDWRCYKGQVSYFSEHFRVVVYDPRGNGQSGRPDSADGYGLDLVVADIAAVMDATSTASAIIVGASRSGLVGAVFAAGYPDMAEAFIAIAPNVPLVARHDHNATLAFDAIYDTYDGWNKFNRAYWRTNYPDWCDFFFGQVFTESHSTKQIDDSNMYAAGGDGEMAIMALDASKSYGVEINDQMYRGISCPVLAIHGDADEVAPLTMSEKLVELTDGELHVIPGAGHAPQARFPGKVNRIMRDFIAAKLGTWKPRPAGVSNGRATKVLYLSSPIGLGHARRDLAVAKALRKQRPEVEIDWLAQDPVTRVLAANNERIHPASRRLANESAHIESEAGEHDLHAFQAVRDMDEILVHNYMLFQDVAEAEGYDLVIADEAWEVDHFWHEHPEFKMGQLAWFTDFVGYVPMPEGGEREAFLTTDYNAEMIEHVDGRPGVRDRALFVGDPEDIAPLSFGAGLPMARDWVPEHFDFTGYILGQHPDTFGERAGLRERFGYYEGEKVCIVTVGGSGVGGHLIRRVLDAYPAAKRRIPELRMIVVTGPRLDPESVAAPSDVEVKAFVPDLDRHLAACDLAIVQGGLTTCMELTAAGTPFIYFPLRRHFEQQFHVAHRLDRYGAGRRMDYATAEPDRIAAAMVDELSARKPVAAVASDGAARAAAMLAELL